MTTVEKITAESFEQVYPLFTSGSELQISREDFKKLFVKRWGADEEYFGYVLVDEGKIVGFLGYLFSRREIAKKTYPFCNLTSWNVLPAFRKYSMQLILPILKDQNYVITTFTARESTHLVLNKLGFEVMEDHVRIIPFFPNVLFGNGNCRIIYDLVEIESKLSGKDLKLFQDHKDLNCLHVVVTLGDRYCYLIIKRAVRKKIPFGFIHYISNFRIFPDILLRINASICFKMGVVGLMIYEKTLNGIKIFPSFKVKLPRPALFKSKTLKKEEVDSLYSEYFLLSGS